MDVDWIARQFPGLSELRPLAQGGQKIVFSATHHSEGEVVLKLLSPLTKTRGYSVKSAADARRAR